MLSKESTEESNSHFYFYASDPLVIKGRTKFHCLLSSTFHASKPFVTNPYRSWVIQICLHRSLSKTSKPWKREKKTKPDQFPRMSSLNLTCSPENQEFLSHFCLEGANKLDPECSPMVGEVRVVAGVICIVVAVVGFLGNLLTLLAIPWSVVNGR